MTAEIALLNKKAVAMASDSAVTIRNSNVAPKIYTSVNKLFQLSKYHPVGVMIFGSAEFMGFPWEVIIKEYRKKLGNKQFSTIKDYGNNFISFLTNNDLFEIESQNSAVRYRSFSFLKYFKNNIDEKIKISLKSKECISESDVIKLFRNEIKSTLEKFTKKKFILGFTSHDIEVILKKYKRSFNETIKKIFDKVPFSNIDRARIRKLLAILHTKDIFSDSFSGVVISGFGKKEIFPAIIEYNFDLVVNNKPKYRKRKEDSITHTKTAIISPFAQSEMVHLFVGGIDPNYDQYISNYFQQILKRLPEELVKIIPEIDKGQEKTLLDKLQNAYNILYEDIIRETSEYKQTHHVNPVLETVDSLPQIELGEMAEALVSLTSFKRKMSLESETVGGPIDVALITKGDGFVWIKRKHYFSPELNHHFFDNYYK
jgi:hypothetical protein